MTSAIPRCGAISAAPETGTISTRRPTDAKNRAVTRGKTVATRVPARMSSSAEMPLSSVAATARRQRPKVEIGQLLERATGLAHEIAPGDAGVGGAIGDELGNVLRPNEERLELAAQRRGEGARAARRGSRGRRR